MKWESLDRKIPWILLLRGSMPPLTVYTWKDIPGYEIRVQQPGKHWKTTPLPGGDFRVEVRSPETTRPQALLFRDVLRDVETKRSWAAREGRLALVDRLSDAIRTVADRTGDPNAESRTVLSTAARVRRTDIPGLPIQVLLAAVQCLALAEERKYGESQAEQGGGRRLLPRVASGILGGYWTADEVAAVLRRTPANRTGSPGGLAALQQLEAAKGWDSGYQ